MKKFIFLFLSFSVSANAQITFDTGSSDNVINFGEPSNNEVAAINFNISANNLQISELVNFLENSRDISASFVQQSYEGGKAQSRSGNLAVKKPNKFFLDYPKEQKIISDGKIVWNYDLGLEQVSKHKRDEMIGDEAMQILSGDKKITDLFEIIAAPKIPKELQIAGAKVFQLNPKAINAEGSQYEKIFISMQNGTIHSIAVDAGGNNKLSLLRLINLKRNAGIPDSKFKFTPPKGVDVIE